MTLAATTIRRTRAAAGLTQRALALAASIPQPVIATIEQGRRDPSSALLERLVRAAGHTLVPVPGVTDVPADFVDAIRDHVLASDDGRAFRTFLSLNDALVRYEPGFLVAVTLADPGTCGAAHYDALVAGLVEHVLDRRALPTPLWVNAPRRFLDHEWFVDDTPYARAHDRTDSPPAFARRGVLIAPTELDAA
ncbi:helix-turn-helix transcriptional regulator [Actinotalea sp. C106]|uniref:helix-turn-helix transcriptional regulator n=1 Tax=Actinotalea sp. C106 TaxID=2908644 RepID=UPI00202885C6|nr:helix-turn-helix transcriptional regulator [Actinotalea sp. C106]